MLHNQAWGINNFNKDLISAPVQQLINNNLNQKIMTILLFVHVF